MPTEGSVAPKERVNIVYKSTVNGRDEETELPLKLLVLGDFTGKVDARPIEDREPIDVNKDNFREVMEKQELGLTISVPDHLADTKGVEPAEMPVTLNFKELEDFSPSRIADGVPDMKKLLELREALTSLKAPITNIPAFRKRIEELLKDPAGRAKLLAELGLEDGTTT